MLLMAAMSALLGVRLVGCTIGGFVFGDADHLTYAVHIVQERVSSKMVEGIPFRFLEANLCKHDYRSCQVVCINGYVWRQTTSVCGYLG